MERFDREEEDELSLDPGTSSPQIPRTAALPPQVSQVPQNMPKGYVFPDSIGFIGLGAMGKPIVLRFAKGYHIKGTKIHIHDINESVLDELCAQHPAIFVRQPNARSVADNADFIMTLLPDASAVTSVYLDPSTGIIASPSLGTTSKTLVDSSTIDLGTNQTIAVRLAAASPASTFHDAPILGGVYNAEHGGLTFLLGCSHAHERRSHHRAIGSSDLHSLLTPMGPNVVHCGAPGRGLAAKNPSSYLTGVITIAGAEAMDMGMRAGVDAEMLHYVLAEAFVDSRQSNNVIGDCYNPVPGVIEEEEVSASNNGYVGGVPMEMVQREMGLALNMARDVDSRNALGESARAVFAGASAAENCRGLDSSVVYRYLGGKEKWSPSED